MGTEDLQKYRANVRKFKSIDKTKMELKPGEKIVHCIDSKSFNGKFYYPQWVVSDEGRVWSLHCNKWMTPQILKREGNSYWGLPTRKKVKKLDYDPKSVYVHALVCNYFKNDSDKIALEFFGEDNIQAHHINAINIPNKLRGKGKRAKKIKQCMKDSCKKNIVYQEKTADHLNDTMMANGRTTTQEKENQSVWSKELQDIRTMFYGSGQLPGNSFGTYYVYSKDEQGNLKKSINMTLGLKGVLDKYTFILGEYKINADENKQFVIDNQDIILEKINQNPPQSHDFTKGFYMNGISILYALK